MDDFEEAARGTRIPADVVLQLIGGKWPESAEPLDWSQAKEFRVESGLLIPFGRLAFDVRRELPIILISACVYSGPTK